MLTRAQLLQQAEIEADAAASAAEEAGPRTTAIAGALEALRLTILATARSETLDGSTIPVSYVSDYSS